MKNNVLIFVLILFGVTVSCTQTQNLKDKEMEENSHELIRLKVGETHEYSVRHIAGGPVFTSLKMPDSCTVSLLSQSINYGPGPDEPGMSGTKKFVFKGETPGKCSVFFQLRNTSEIMHEKEVIFEVRK